MERFTLTGRAGAVRIEPAETDRIIVRFPYSPEYVAKIRTVPGRRWHPDQKHWTVPHNDAALAHLLALFSDRPIDLDPALRPAHRRDGQAAQAALEIPDGSPQTPGLLDRVREALRARHYSRRTEQAYAAWIIRFVEFHGRRDSGEVDEREVNAFLTHLAVGDRVAASTQNQALAALLFLYDSVLHRPLGRIEGVIRARRPRRLPVVLAPKEVRAVLDGLDGTPRLVCALLYGSGLRLLECLRLRVKDIDFQRNEITIRDGKGGKDRVTMLPAAVKALLRAHLEKVRRQHEKDLARDLGRVPLPDALVRKYPGADRQWAWAVGLPGLVTLRRRPHRGVPQAPSARVGHPTGREGGGAAGGGDQARVMSHLQAFVRYAPPGKWIRHSNRPGVARAQRREDHDGVHSRAEPRRERGQEPHRRAAVLRQAGGPRHVRLTGLPA